jgi:trans-2,3-dihydro-3-hydroxyanthranilate isomerase
MRRRFFTLDVFTAQRFAGNPLAVVLEPDGLGTATMQTIAREFGHPETVFVFRPDAAGQRARIRIFTPGREIAFAGHPTVGTAVLLAHLDGGASPRELVLGEGVGPVVCVVEPASGGGAARFTVPRPPERIAASMDAARVPAALGLAAGDIGCDGFALENWSAGNPFSFVPVRGLDAIRRAQPDLAKWDDAFGTEGPVGAFLFCRETLEPAHSFHARMFAPRAGVPEDPATGSAVAAFAGILAAAGGLADGDHAFAVEQGIEMGRPSLLRLGLTLRGGALQSATVGGDAVIVTEGAIEA